MDRFGVLTCSVDISEYGWMCSSEYFWKCPELLGLLPPHNWWYNHTSAFSLTQCQPV